jgi:hypothetical protein
VIYGEMLSLYIEVVIIVFDNEMKNMRGESFIHSLIVIAMCLYALNIAVYFAGYVITYSDMLVVSVFVYLLGAFVILITGVKESDWRGRDKGYVEDDMIVTLLIRGMCIIILMIPVSSMWHIGLLVDGVFIYLLIAWGYMIILIALSIAELVFKYTQCKIVEQKG